MSGTAARSPGGITVSSGARVSLLIPFVVFFVVFGDRARLTFATGGQGALPLSVLVLPVVAFLTVLRYGTWRSLGFVSHPAFVLGVLPYLILSGLLPILGVMFNGYLDRTLLSVTEATTAMSYLVLGAALSRSSDRAWAPWILLAIAIQLVYAVGQAVYLTGGPGSDLFAPFHAWDLTYLDLRRFVQSRGSGLYLNPNELGLWAGVAIIWCLSMVQGRLRVLGLGLAALTLLLSESRGAITALAVALIAGAVIGIARGKVNLGTARAGLSIGLAIAIAVAMAFAITPVGSLEERLGSLIEVGTEGPQVDPNLAGRISFWRAATDLSADYPLGTWGAPEALLGTATDSNWFRAFAQGSVFYLGALILLLVVPFVIGRVRHGLALQLVTIVVAVAAITQTPLQYPVIALFWVLLGTGLQSSMEARFAFPAAGPSRRDRIRAVDVRAGGDLRRGGAGAIGFGFDDGGVSPGRPQGQGSG